MFMDRVRELLGAVVRKLLKGLLILVVCTVLLVAVTVGLVAFDVIDDPRAMLADASAAVGGVSWRQLGGYLVVGFLVVFVGKDLLDEWAGTGSHSGRQENHRDPRGDRSDGPGDRS